MGITTITLSVPANNKEEALAELYQCLNEIYQL